LDCTLALSRLTWSLLSYSLPSVAEAAGVPLDHHHEPEADASAAAATLVAIAHEHDASSVDDLVSKTIVRLGSMSPGLWLACHADWSGSRRQMPSVNENANPDHPFFGREIVFTWTLLSMTKDEARELVAEVGGRPAAGVTKTTNILVEGYQDASRLRPGESLSAKARKARNLRAGGQEIELMDEVDFLRLRSL
jgi:NAD-dependent DNA ligase